MKRTNLFIREDQLEAMRKIQKKQGVPVAEQVRRAIDDYLKRQEKKR